MSLKILYYHEDSFVSEFFGSVSFCFISAIIVILAISSIYIAANINYIRNDWPNQKCKPYIMPFAGYINKPENQTVLEFTEENFIYCQQNVFKALISDMLTPLHELIDSVSQLFADITNEIQAMRIAMANLRTHLTDIFNTILMLIGVIVVPLQEIFIVAKDTIAKVTGIVITGIYVVLGILEAFKASIKIFIEAAVVILIILAALIISLFADVFTIPIAIAGLVVFISLCDPFRQFVQFTEETLGITSSKPIPNDPVAPTHFCFAQTSLLNSKLVDTFNVGDLWPFNGGGIITAKIKLRINNNNTSFYSPTKDKTLQVTESHKIFYNNKWVSVKDHPEFRRVICNDSKKGTTVYCFNTTTKRLPIGEYLFLDWDEFDQIFEDYEDTKGLHNSVILENGKKVEDTDLNDWISNNQQVLGIVYLPNNFRSFITTNQKINLFDKTVIPDYNDSAETFLKNRKNKNNF